MRYYFKKYIKKLQYLYERGEDLFVFYCPINNESKNLFVSIRAFGEGFTESERRQKKSTRF